MSIEAVRRLAIQIGLRSYAAVGAVQLPTAAAARPADPPPCRQAAPKDPCGEGSRLAPTPPSCRPQWVGLPPPLGQLADRIGVNSKPGRPGATPGAY